VVVQFEFAQALTQTGSMKDDDKPKNKTVTNRKRKSAEKKIARKEGTIEQHIADINERYRITETELANISPPKSKAARM
jgi:hypothetical protein